MRLQDNSKIILSDDASTQPKNIRFSQEFEDIDLTLLKESITYQQKYPAGAAAIGMGTIAQGRFLAILPKGTNNLPITLNGQSLTLRANKLTKLWTNFTSLAINPVIEQEVLIVIAGE